LEVRVEDQQDYRLVSVRGEIDMATSPLLENKLLEVEADETRPIWLDLREVTSMDVTGLRVLLNASARSRSDHDHRLRIIQAPPEVHRVFQLTRTEKLLPLVDP